MREGAGPKVGFLLRREGYCLSKVSIWQFLFNFDADPIQFRILDPNWKNINPDPGHLKNLNNFFSLIFTLKLDEPYRNQESFIISIFLKVQIWVLKESKKTFSSFWLIIFPLYPDIWIPLVSGSMDSHIFVDQDPGSQNL